MNDSECVAFLQWALPQLGLRWDGFRKVRRQVCRRLSRRLAELGLPDLRAYRARLEHDRAEWAVLDDLTHITISRFHRDRHVFAALQHDVIPVLAAAAQARGSHDVEVWSAGCGSGEEPYTVAIMWELELARLFPSLTMRVIATDIDDAMLVRARRACYGDGSLKELPEHWSAAAFVRDGGLHCLRDTFRASVTVRRHDIRRPQPDGPFDLVLCRNLAFTYFDADAQRAAAARVADALRPGGALVLGTHEALPADSDRFEPWSSSTAIQRRISARVTTF
jgi:chemotaxis protein methyltransferase CheR